MLAQILMVIMNACSSCGSNNIVKNGKTSTGKQKYFCKDCNAYRTLGATQVYTEEEKERILAAYKERSILRGIQRSHKVAVTSVLRWLKKSRKIRQLCIISFASKTL